MRQPVKYFVFNKRSDFVRGSHYNISLLSQGITIEDSKSGVGDFFSRILDAREKQMPFHRILVEGESISEATARIWVYTSESRKIYLDNEERDIGEILEDASIPVSRKQEILEPYCRKSIRNPKDMLLHEVQGRYLWIRIQLVAQGKFLPQITKIKIIFPKNTWLDFLPDVYQENAVSASFVERYLGMFQSLYQDMTDQIHRIPQYLDPDAAQGPFLEWLSTWLSVEDSYLWNEEQLRYLVLHGRELYRKRGTVEYMQEMVRLYTGRTPYIVEYQHLEPYQGNPDHMEHLQMLYGKNSYSFTIVVDMNGRISNKEYQVLTRIVERAKPAHVESNIVVLEPYIFLDKHSYIGINSELSNYRAFVLDGQASIPFTTLKENEETKGDEQ